MSMNLNANNKKGETVRLWQTPTWVTYMCIDSWKKDKSGYCKQRKWKDTRKLYLDWCYSSTQGVFRDNEGEEAFKRYTEHVEYIMSQGKIKFWVM